MGSFTSANLCHCARYFKYDCIYDTVTCCGGQIKIQEHVEIILPSTESKYSIQLLGLNDVPDS